MIEIVKVQVALMPKGAPALIIPKDCAAKIAEVGHMQGGGRIQTRKLDADTLRALNGDSKGYFKASFVGGRWKLGRRVQDQDW